MTAKDISFLFFPFLLSSLTSRIILQQRNNFYSAGSGPLSLTLTDGLNWNRILLDRAQAFLYKFRSKDSEMDIFAHYVDPTSANFMNAKNYFHFFY